jgi:hypothetical protein
VAVLALTLLIHAAVAAPASAASYAHEARLTAGIAWDQFGFAVAIHGNTAVVGAIKTDSTETGEVHVFVRQDGTWRYQARLASVGIGLGFGHSVAIHGDTIVVGKIDHSWDAGAGSAHVYVRSGSTWRYQAKLAAPDGAIGDYFGESVAISGNTIVVGAPYDDNGKYVDRGSAHVFVRSGATWTRQATLVPIGGGHQDNFGGSVAINGDTLVVGAPQTGNAGPGAAYVFARSAAMWSQEARLTASDVKNAAWFGESVALTATEDRIVVGAPFANVGQTTYQGAAYVFARTGGSWTQQATLTASNGAADDAFGVSVAVHDSEIVVGAPRSEVFGRTNQGSAYVFECSGPCVETQRLFASGTAHDNFGYAVAMDQAGTNTVIVGVPLADVWPPFGRNKQVNQGVADVFSLR